MQRFMVVLTCHRLVLAIRGSNLQNMGTSSLVRAGRRRDPPAHRCRAFATASKGGPLETRSTSVVATSPSPTRGPEWRIPSWSRRAESSRADVPAPSGQSVQAIRPPTDHWAHRTSPRTGRGVTRSYDLLQENTPLSLHLEKPLEKFIAY
jgi:hypothetical protein